MGGVGRAQPILETERNNGCMHCVSKAFGLLYFIYVQPGMCALYPVRDTYACIADYE